LIGLFLRKGHSAKMNRRGKGFALYIYAGKKAVEAPYRFPKREGFPSIELFLGRGSETQAFQVSRFKTVASDDREVFQAGNFIKAVRVTAGDDDGFVFLLKPEKKLAGGGRNQGMFGVLFKVGHGAVIVQKKKKRLFLSGGEERVVVFFHRLNFFYGMRIILPWAPGFMTASWDWAASFKGSSCPTMGFREPSVRPLIKSA